MTFTPAELADIVATGIKAAMRPALTRLAALEAARADQVTDEDITREVAALVRRELLGALPPALKMQKRIIRDQHGKIARVVEEPEAR